MNDLKLIFFGTPKFAVDSLHEINLNYTVNCVVTSPDKKLGEVKKLPRVKLRIMLKKIILKFFNLIILMTKNLLIK